MDRSPPPPDTFHYKMHHPGVTVGVSYNIPPPPPNNEHILREENDSLKSLNDGLNNEIRKLKSEKNRLKIDNKALKEALTTWYGHAENLRKLVVGFNSGLAGVLDLGGNWRGADQTTTSSNGNANATAGPTRRWS